jgi:hypothetical protein
MLPSRWCNNDFYLFVSIFLAKTAATSRRNAFMFDFHFDRNDADANMTTATSSRLAPASRNVRPIL